MKASTTTSTSNTIDFDGKCWDEVKQYILNCPYVSTNHPSIMVATKALDLERQRQERDAKLRRKFSSKTNGATTAIGVVRNNNTSDEEPVIVPYDTTTNATPTIVQQTNSTCCNEDNGAYLKSVVGTPIGDDRMMMDNHEDDDDWQDVDRDEERKLTMGNTTDSSMLDGATHDVDVAHQLAKIAVSLLGSNQVTVQSPLAAIAIAFHAILVCPIYQFVCTGIPERNNNKTTTVGFAAPIRDLPKTQFVPTKWETEQNNTAQNITIRYRKIDGSISTRLLTVSLVDDDSNNNSNSNPIVEVRWSSPSTLMSETTTAPTAPAATATTALNEPIPSVFRFKLKEHFNMESWTKSLKTTTSTSVSDSTTGSSGSVSPILHYKHLYLLLSKFCQHFDFGTVCDGNADKAIDSSAVTSSIPYSDYSVQQLPTRMNGITKPITPKSTTHGDSLTDPLRIPTRREMLPGFDATPFHNNNPYHHPRHGGSGDFDGDLFHPVIHQNNPSDPFGRIVVGGGMVNPSFPGNLLGPNHPSFRGPFPSQPTNQDDPAYNGFGGMKPRFDPYGPPPTNPDTSNIDGSCRNNGLPDGVSPNHGFGPNPDHLCPPTFGINNKNNFNSNMFM